MSHSVLSLFVTFFAVMSSIEGVMAQGVNPIATCIVKSEGNPEYLKDCLIGKHSPEFDVTSMDNKRYSSSELKGKVVLLIFWFNNCPPCIQEIPHLNSLYENFKANDDFQLVSLSMDSYEAISKLMIQHPIKYPVIPSSKVVIENDFHINSIGYPTSLVLSKRGTIIEFHAGISKEEVKITSHFNKLSALIKAELNK